MGGGEPASVETSEPIDLGRLIANVIGGYRLHGQLRGVAVQPDVREATLVVGDEPSLRLAIGNLVANAIEASATRQGVEVVVDREDDRAVIDVHDHGRGLGTLARTRAFEPFFSTKFGHEGLGLPVARAVARAHGGELMLIRRRGVTTQRLLLRAGSTELH